MCKVIILGHSSYLAQGVPEYFSKKGLLVRVLHWRDWSKYIDELRQADAVINFAMSPEFSKREMSLDEVLDVNIAKVLKDTKVQYVFFSSRKVYGYDTECRVYDEDSALKGFDAYSCNKIKVENFLRDILPDSCAILRVSNIMGDLSLRTHSGTFMGWIRENYLKYGKLIVNQRVDVIKDFVTHEFVKKVLYKVIKERLVGVYNVSSNESIVLADLLSLCVGGNVQVEASVSLSDQFLLNNSRLYAATGLRCTREEIESCARNNWKILQNIQS